MKSTSDAPLNEYAQASAPDTSAPQVYEPYDWTHKSILNDAEKYSYYVTPPTTLSFWTRLTKEGKENQCQLDYAHALRAAASLLEDESYAQWRIGHEARTREDSIDTLQMWIDQYDQNAKEMHENYKMGDRKYGSSRTLFRDGAKMALDALVSAPEAAIRDIRDAFLAQAVQIELNIDDIYRRKFLVSDKVGKMAAEQLAERESYAETKAVEENFAARYIRHDVTFLNEIDPHNEQLRRAISRLPSEQRDVQKDLLAKNKLKLDVVAHDLPELFDMREKVRAIMNSTINEGNGTGYALDGTKIVAHENDSQRMFEIIYPAVGQEPQRVRIILDLNQKPQKKQPITNDSAENIPHEKQYCAEDIRQMTDIAILFGADRADLSQALPQDLLDQIFQHKE